MTDCDGAHLNIVLGQFLGEGAAPARRRVDRVVDGDLAVFVIQPCVNVLAALFQYLLPENDGRGRGIGEEVVVGDGALGANGGAAVVAEVEDASLDAEPLQVPCERDADVAARASRVSRPARRARACEGALRLTSFREQVAQP